MLLLCLTIILSSCLEVIVSGRQLMAEYLPQSIVRQWLLFIPTYCCVLPIVLYSLRYRLLSLLSSCTLLPNTYSSISTAGPNPVHSQELDIPLPHIFTKPTRAHYTLTQTEQGAPRSLQHPHLYTLNLMRFITIHFVSHHTGDFHHLPRGHKRHQPHAGLMP